ncbi:MAG TPA: TIGR03435 family protein [Bryobacteraceae bacterium]|nr:TIGR03435 family protein [Bryobacteraceae bacterium]
MDINVRRDFAGILLASSLVLAIGTGRELRAQSQSAAVSPAFELASVRPTGRPPNSGTTGWTVSHGTFTAHDAWVQAMVAVAYGVHAAQVHGGPAWIDAELYDVIAKAENTDVGLDQIRPMLRTLLTDRFKLVVHDETQEGPIYTLIAGKNGSKLQEASETEKTYVNSAGRGRLVFKRVNVQALVISLTNTLGTPVIDKTGLTGFYDFSLEWTGPIIPAGERRATHRRSPRHIRSRARSARTQFGNEEGTRGNCDH